MAILVNNPIRQNLPNYISPNLFDSDGLSNQGDSASVITDFKIRARYERDGRTYMMGISSPNGFNGQSVAFVQLAAPTLLWIADWTGARFLDKPMIPDPTTVSAGWVLLDVMLEPAEIVLAQNGSTPLYRLTGTYIFGQQNPGPNFYSNVCFPTAPWFTNAGLAALRTIEPADLDTTGLLQPPDLALQPLGPGLGQG